MPSESRPDRPEDVDLQVSDILPAKAAVAKVQHHTSMPHGELPSFWPRLQVQGGLGTRALELCILTTTRTGELPAARRDEIDIGTRTWVVPAGRMKAGVEHRIPLSDPAIELLRKLSAIRVGELVFPGQSTGWSLSAMTMITLRRTKVPVTPHGFRVTLGRRWPSRPAFPHEVAEAALAHTVGDKVVAAYQRGAVEKARRNQPPPCHPAGSHTDRGKSAIVLPVKCAKAITEAVRRVTRDWCEARKAEERDRHRAWRDREKAERGDA